MRDALTGLLEKADLAIASASEVVDEETLRPLIQVVRDVRARLAYPDEILVVALAGGTGSGKSSLFNALCDEELVDVGGVRPTTSSPAAAVPVDAGGALDGYLDRLGIEERHTYVGSPVCLLDLPDTDSVEGDNRYRVDSILPLVDVVVWVVDPEKYRDARLHREYLQPMAEYSAQFLFVVNQVDRLTESEGDEVRNDMRLALEEDWIEAPHVILMAAGPPAGPPMGLEALQEALEAKRADRETLYGKLLTDVSAACRTLETVVGRGLEFDERAADVLTAAVDALEAGDQVGATRILTGFIEALEAESGGVTARKLAIIAAETPQHVQRVDARTSASDPTPKKRRFRWWGAADEPTTGVDEEKARALLSEAVIRPARAVLARRGMAVASVAELAIDVETLRASGSR